MAKTARKNNVGKKTAGKANKTTATDMGAVREAILAEALGQVPFDGWVQSTLDAAATALGHEPTMALRAFPRGPIEAIELHSHFADRTMLEALEAMDMDAMKVRERIATGVRLRLEQNAVHREAICRAASLLAQPLHAPLAARLTWRTVNAIWIAAGDTATDYNYYTKRGLLAGVYTATLLFWLNDRSEGNEASWAFLERRIAEVLRIPKAIGALKHLVGRLPNPFLILRPRV